MFHDIYNWLELYGFWSLISLMIVKLVTGVAVAIQKNEFKWYYLANFLKNDAVKVVVLIVLSVFLKQDALTASIGAMLVLDFTAGIAKNVAHMFPGVAQNTPTTLREPARLRLGNPKSTL